MGTFYDTTTSQFYPNLIPPYIAKGELVTGVQMLSEARRTYLNSTPGYTRDRIPVPAGEDGSVLQADSTTNTGLRWVPHEPIAKSVKHELRTVIQFLKPMIQERIIKEAERLESLPKLFVRSGTATYTIPMDTSKTVQSVFSRPKFPIRITNEAPRYSTPAKSVEANSRDTSWQSEYLWRDSKRYQEWSSCRRYGLWR